MHDLEQLREAVEFWQGATAACGLLALVLAFLLWGMWRYHRSLVDRWCAAWRWAKRQLADAGITIIPVRPFDHPEDDDE